MLLLSLRRLHEIISISEILIAVRHLYVEDFAVLESRMLPRIQAAKLGFFITGPWASASLKPTGLSLVLLVQIIYNYMKTSRLPNIFYHGAKIERK